MKGIRLLSVIAAAVALPCFGAAQVGRDIGGGFALSGHVAYCDFLFDRQIRDASRDCELTGRWGDSLNFVGGLALTVNF